MAEALLIANYVKTHIDDAAKEDDLPKKPRRRARKK